VQLTSETIEAQQSAAEQYNDAPATADAKEAASSSSCRNDVGLHESHLRSGSSNSKIMHHIGSSGMSKHHSSAFVKVKNDKQKVVHDKIHSRPCSQKFVSSVDSLTVRLDDLPGGDGDSLLHCSTNTFDVKTDTKSQESAVSDLPLLSKVTETVDKSQSGNHIQLHRYSTDTTKRKKHHSSRIASADVTRSTSHRGSHILRSDINKVDNSATESSLNETEKEVISCADVETIPSKLVRTNVSKTGLMIVQDIDEKQSTNISDSGRHSTRAGSIPPAKTFEQMLNYDSAGVVIRKKKRSVHKADKHLKVPQLSSHSTLCASPSATSVIKHSPSSHLQNASKNSPLSVESHEFGRSQRPAVPQPDQQVYSVFSFCDCLVTDVIYFFT